MSQILISVPSHRLRAVASLGDQDIRNGFQRYSSKQRKHTMQAAMIRLSLGAATQVKAR